MMVELFEKALNISTPWYIKDIHFDSEVKRLDIEIDLKKMHYLTIWIMDKDKNVEHKNGSFQKYLDMI